MKKKSSYDLQQLGKATVAVVHGELQGRLVEDLKKALGQALEQPDCSTVALDASEVHFMDSSGISLLVFLQKNAGFLDKNFALLRPSKEVREVLELVQLKGFITIQESL